jgi:hypothetical protein
LAGETPARATASPLVEGKPQSSGPEFRWSRRPHAKHLLTVFPRNFAFSLKICRSAQCYSTTSKSDFSLFVTQPFRIRALEFQSANPTVVKSIKQRDLLNTWLRLYARDQKVPRKAEYEPSRIEDEIPDLVYYTVEASEQSPRLLIDSDGTRMSSAYGHTGKGRYLDEYLGPRLAPIVMPVYFECIARALPIYTIAHIDDIYGRIVAYERLLLPFSEDGNVRHIIASLKTISEDGNFEIKNLMRGNDTLPTPKLRAVIDRDLFHRAPGRIPAGDVIEFS